MGYSQTNFKPEENWDARIARRDLINQWQQILPRPTTITVDARREIPTVINGPSLQKLLADNNDVLRVARPIMEELSRLIPEDAYIALSHPNGVILAICNATSPGTVCPVISADRDRIMDCMERRVLLETRATINRDLFETDTIHSIAYPIFDHEHAFQVMLSIGCFAEGLTDECRALTYLGAHLIETHYKHQILFRDYAHVMINALPDMALLIDQEGMVHYANDRFLSATGTHTPDSVIGEPFFGRFSACSKQKADRIVQGTDASIKLNVPEGAISCRVADGGSVATPLGDKLRLLVLKKETAHTGERSNRLHEKANPFGFEKLISRSPQMEEIKRIAAKAAASSFSILLEGESGTGKELLARAIHYESARPGPFIPINCAGIPRELLQSELFGYEEGTFTGGQRGGKTGDTRTGGQRHGPVRRDRGNAARHAGHPLAFSAGQGRHPSGRNPRQNGRCAHHCRNQPSVDGGYSRRARFRLDLYNYRLNEINIGLPPLRDRKADIPLLVHRHGCRTVCKEHQLESARVRRGGHGLPDASAGTGPATAVNCRMS